MSRSQNEVFSEQELSTFAKLENSLPPILGRLAAEQFTGGVVTAKTLANQDCLGLGPPSIRIGRKIAYERSAFIEWLKVRASKCKNNSDFNNELNHQKENNDGN